MVFANQYHNLKLHSVFKDYGHNSKHMPA